MQNAKCKILPLRLLVTVRYSYSRHNCFVKRSTKLYNEKELLSGLQK